MATVAVCLAGLLNLLPDVGRSIQDFLVAPLGADVFISGPSGGVGQWGSALGLFPTLAQASVERENVTEFLHGLGGDGSGWRAAATIKGNWLGCLEGEEKDMRRDGSGLCLLYGHRRCLSMIEEREQKRGRLYRHVVWSRADLMWLTEHFPLSLLPEGESDFWVVDGEDNGGINDRHWVMPRHLAPLMLGSWDRLLDGSLADFFQAQRLPQLSTETFFSYVLATSGLNVLVRRVPCLAYVPCASFNDRKHIDTSASGWDDSGRLGNVNVRCALGGPKYRHEYRHARQVADCKGPGRWTLPLLWRCWCAEKEEAGVLAFVEYRLCLHAKVAASG